MEVTLKFNEEQSKILKARAESEWSKPSQVIKSILVRELIKKD